MSDRVGLVRDAFIVSGIGFMSYGAGLWSRPLGFVVLGALLASVGLAGTIRARTSPPPGAE